MIDVKRVALRLVAVVVGLPLLYLIATPTGRYIVRAAWAEAGILARRQPIEKLVADSSTAPAVRDKLRLVLAARGFAADSVRLDAGKSFTTYTQLDRDTLVLVLSAAYRDELRMKTWWFPVVGRVPYKGYFDFDRARRAAEELQAEGLDAFVRPASAFSTLGWFDDPLVSSTLRVDSLDLANTVIHELTHNTFYASGEAAFNESFANFVGARGAAWFFRVRGAPRAAAEVDARWEDEKLLARFWERLYRRVDSAYKAHPDNRDARLAARSTLTHEARRELVHDLGPQLRTIGPRTLERIRLDNAALLARRVYLTDIDVFEAVWRREGRRLDRAVIRIVDLARDAENPFDALRAWVDAGSAAESPPK